jgi:hypothetical protein
MDQTGSKAMVCLAGMTFVMSQPSIHLEFVSRFLEETEGKPSLFPKA